MPRPKLIDHVTTLSHGPHAGGSPPAPSHPPHPSHPQHHGHEEAHTRRVEVLLGLGQFTGLWEHRAGGACVCTAGVAYRVWLGMWPLDLDAELWKSRYGTVMLGGSVVRLLAVGHSSPGGGWTGNCGWHGTTYRSGQRGLQYLAPSKATCKPGVGAVLTSLIYAAVRKSDSWTTLFPRRLGTPLGPRAAHLQVPAGRVRGSG